MRRSPLFRLGVATLAALCAAGLAAPAHADPDSGAGTVTGRLTDHADKPAARAAVTVYDANDEEKQLATTTTDGDGRFTVADLAEGEVKVLFEYRGLRRWAGGVAYHYEAEVFTITATGTVTVDLKLPIPALQGRLFDHAGNPAADAWVSVYDDKDQESIDSTGTDAEGWFALVALSPGKIKLQFGYHSFEVWAGGTDDYDKAKVFTITAGKTTTVEGKLPPLGLFQGRLVDHAGAPVPSARLRTAEEKTGNFSYAVTDDDGRWQVAAPPGLYRLSFDVDGFEQYVPHTREYEEAGLFTIDAGQTVPVEEALLPTGKVTGTLVNAKGKAVHGADVTLYQNGMSSGYAQTDEEGRFSYERVFAGTWKVRFDPPKGPAQWAYGKRSETTATPITVTADQVATVDEKLLVLGTVAGRFTDRKGKGIAKASVEVSAADEDEGVEDSFSTKTDSKGRYKVTGVLPGTYKVGFTDRSKRTQYAYGKGDRKTARVFTVKSGKTTTVNDKQVPPATLRITAVDAKTGKKLSNFCVYVPGVPNGDGCTKKSVLVVKNLPATTVEVSTRPASEKSLYLSRDVKAKTTAGKTTKITAKLQLGGAITATVVARSTGKAVRDACLAAVVPGRGGLPDGYADCANAKGKIRTSPLAPGTYNLFVNPPEPLGMQWVGKSGGTGDQRAAAKIIVKAGKVVNAPKIKVDKAGGVTGTVTTPDGKPVTVGDVSISAWHYRVGGRGADLDRQGRYTLDGLGPYQWPLVFTTDHGRQWSGGKGNRFAATTVLIKVGEAVTHDEVIQPQSQLTGKVAVRKGKLDHGFLMAHTTSTGDPIGDIWFWADGTYAMRVPGGEKVKIEYGIEIDSDDYLFGWYDNAKTFEKAKVVEVPASGARTLNVTVR